MLPRNLSKYFTCVKNVTAVRASLGNYLLSAAQMRLTQFAGSDEVFAFNNVTENEVYFFVRGLSFNKDPGCDKVST